MDSFRIITGMTTAERSIFWILPMKYFPFLSLPFSLHFSGQLYCTGQSSFPSSPLNFQLPAEVCAELKCQIKSCWISSLHSSARLYFREIFATEPELPRSNLDWLAWLPSCFLGLLYSDSETIIIIAFLFLFGVYEYELEIGGKHCKLNTLLFLLLHVSSDFYCLVYSPTCHWMEGAGHSSTQLKSDFCSTSNRYNTVLQWESVTFHYLWHLVQLKPGLMALGWVSRFSLSHSSIDLFLFFVLFCFSLISFFNLRDWS